MHIRLLNQQDAQALWNLRMLALETDPWSFVESPEELQKIPVTEYDARLRANGPENFIVGAFDQDDLVAMVGFYREQPLK